MARLTVVSFRLGGTDGVSIEADKWIRAFRTLGHDATTLAGDGSADVIMPELAIRAAREPNLGDLSNALKDTDVVLVENMASLPLNVAARDALYRVLEGRPALFRHHDLAWQRLTSIDDDAPRDGANWSHVTINDLSRRELAERGVTAQTIYNAFDCDPPRGRRDITRSALHVGDEDFVLLFPARAIPRKNVSGALALAESLGAVRPKTDTTTRCLSLWRTAMHASSPDFQKGSTSTTPTRGLTLSSCPRRGKASAIPCWNRWPTTGPSPSIRIQCSMRSSRSGSDFSRSKMSVPSVPSSKNPTRDC
jgi:hypothetical protein